MGGWMDGWMEWMEAQDAVTRSSSADLVTSALLSLLTKVAPHHAVPGRRVLLVKFLLDKGGDVFFDGVLVDGLV